MSGAKIRSAPNRWKSSWEFSAKIAQAFHIAKKLKKILSLPRKVDFPLQKEGFFLRNIKIHRAIGIKLLELDQDHSRKRAFKIFDYLLVSRYPKAKTITFLASDALRSFVKADQKDGKKPGQKEWINTLDSLLRSEKTPISTDYSLIFNEINSDYRDSADYVFEWEIKRPENFKEPSHPLARIKAFFWTRRNYRMLVQAGFIKAEA